MRPRVRTFASALNNANIIGSYNQPSTCNEESLQSSYLVENIRQNCFQGTKPPQIYSFLHTKITQSYSFHSIYPRVRTKITPKKIQIHNTQSNTKNLKECSRFLLEKQRQERASTPMHRLPQCHLGNPRIECQNIYQVNQYDTPLSPRVFVARHTSSVLKSIEVFNPIIVKPQR